MEEIPVRVMDAIQVDMHKGWSVILSLATPPERCIKIVESESLPVQGKGKGLLVAPAGMPLGHPLTLAFAEGDVDHEVMGAFVNRLRDNGWTVEVELQGAGPRQVHRQAAWVS